MDQTQSLVETLKLEKIAAHYQEILALVAPDPTLPGLAKTPMRAAKALLEMSQGYQEDIDALINDAFYESSNTGIVLSKNIEFSSLCEHHLLPFVGKAHIAYVPDGTVIGLSKLSRILDHFAKRFQIQEHLCDQIAHLLAEKLKPKGVAVILEAEHFCMRLRGVKKQCSHMVSSSFLGAFKEDPNLKTELYRQIGY